MSKMLLTAGMCFVVALGAFNVNAGEEVDFEMMENFSGVYYPKVDKSSGDLISLYVSGKARLSNAFSPGQARLVAEEQATLIAKEKVVAYIKEHLRTKSGLTDQTLVSQEGTEGAKSLDKGKSIMVSSKEIETRSQAVIRGLVPVRVKLKPDTTGETFFIVIFKWSVKQTANAAYIEKVTKESLATDMKKKDANDSKKVNGDSQKKQSVEVHTVPDFSDL